MNARLFAGAFLRHSDEVLLMRRGAHKKISPGLWAGIGGHIENGECDDPALACLREIEEETGISPRDVRDLKLRCYAVCMSNETIDTIYYFAAALEEKHSLIQTDEGTLHWVDMHAALALPMASHLKKFYAHWVANPDYDGILCLLCGSDGEIISHEIN